MDSIVNLQNISVKYQKTVALNNVNLDIYPGEYIGIFGPNGSGKTTLLKVILGLIKPVGGTVTRYKSTNFKKNQFKIGYVPQNPTVNKTFPASVIDVVEMGLYGKVGFLKPLKPIHRKMAEKALHYVHMGSYKNRPIGHLSGGELQKVMVARAIAFEPELLLLDEPTSSLDFVMTRDLMEILAELNKDLNITIICINHHLDLLVPYCTRLLVMNKSILYDGPPDDPQKNQVINQVFGLQGAKFEL
ncbi:MAG: metal ABC transporter ATP-binding protein [Candidatus Lokiarchaeota archaeon]|nr:metal ABC transporter ATP-binding protein [Candidatus Lokiarchaeota archaeon]